MSGPPAVERGARVFLGVHERSAIFHEHHVALHVVLVLTDQQSVWTLRRTTGRSHPPRQLRRLPAVVQRAAATPSSTRQARGALFTNFVVASPACVPSRYSLLTSIDPLCCRQKPRDDACAGGDAMRHTLGHELSRRDYATFYLGKWHLGHDRTGNPVQWDDGTLPPGTAGFAHTRYMIADVNHPKTMVDVDEEAAAGGVPTILRHAELDGAPSKGAADECDAAGVRWENSATTTTLLSYDVPCTNPERHYATNFLFRHATRLLDAHLDEATTQPAFMVVSIPDPHPSYNTRLPHRSRYAGRAGYPATINDPAPILANRNLAPSFSKLASWGYSVSKLDLQRSWYMGMVSLVDEGIGNLTATLQRRNALDDTLLLFTSDHGDHLGAHGNREKMTTYDESLRVPFLLHWPARVAAATVSTSPPPSTCGLPSPASLASRRGRTPPAAISRRCCSTTLRRPRRPPTRVVSSSFSAGGRAEPGV